MRAQLNGLSAQQLIKCPDGLLQEDFTGAIAADGRCRHHPAEGGIFFIDCQCKTAYPVENILEGIATAADGSDPFFIVVVLALFINIVTGWHKKALMVLRANTSMVLLVLLAAVAIVVFFTVFSSRYQREQKEQRYQELLAKKKAWEADEASAH